MRGKSKDGYHGNGCFNQPLISRTTATKLTNRWLRLSTIPEKISSKKKASSTSALKLLIKQTLTLDILTAVHQGPVQSWISVNPGLKFNPLSWFLHFCMSAYFKTSEKKTPFDPDKISEGICPSL